MYLDDVISIAMTAAICKYGTNTGILGESAPNGGGRCRIDSGNCWLASKLVEVVAG